MSAISSQLITPPEWTVSAVCASDPVIFFPKLGGNTAEAKRICSECPVIQECLAWALEYESGSVDGTESNESHGVYGGLSAAERRALLRDQDAA